MEECGEGGTGRMNSTDNRCEKAWVRNATQTRNAMYGQCDAGWCQWEGKGKKFDGKYSSDEVKDLANAEELYVQLKWKVNGRERA